MRNTTKADATCRTSDRGSCFRSKNEGAGGLPGTRNDAMIDHRKDTVAECVGLFKSVIEMVKNESQTIKYRHPFAAVTSSLWSKYDAHKYVKEVEVLERYLDDAGRLHSKRLLTMRGSLPMIFQPFVPVRSVYMLETVVVDAKKQIMTVETTNLNCRSVLQACSKSRYTPDASSPEETTKYEIAILVNAFPKSKEQEGSLPTDASISRSEGKSEWKFEFVSSSNAEAESKSSGYIGGKLETWAASKLLSNVSKGEKYIEGFCRRWRERHMIYCDQSEGHWHHHSSGHYSPFHHSYEDATSLECDNDALASCRNILSQNKRVSKYLYSRFMESKYPIVWVQSKGSDDKEIIHLIRASIFYIHSSLL
eukprot:744177-Hanusia_phi.AAC.1